MSAAPAGHPGAPGSSAARSRSKSPRTRRASRSPGRSSSRHRSSASGSPSNSRNEVKRESDSRNGSSRDRRSPRSRSRSRSRSPRDTRGSRRSRSRRSRSRSPSRSRRHRSSRSRSRSRHYRPRGASRDRREPRGRERSPERDRGRHRHRSSGSRSRSPDLRSARVKQEPVEDVAVKLELGHDTQGQPGTGDERRRRPSWDLSEFGNDRVHPAFPGPITEGPSPPVRVKAEFGHPRASSRFSSRAPVSADPGAAAQTPGGVNGSLIGAHLEKERGRGGSQQHLQQQQQGANKTSRFATKAARRERRRQEEAEDALREQNWGKAKAEVESQQQQQQSAIRGETDPMAGIAGGQGGADEAPKEKEKFSLGQSGLLEAHEQAAAVTGGTSLGAIQKYGEPPDACPPEPNDRWHVFVFKGDSDTPVERHRLMGRSHWILGRDDQLADIHAAHASCSKQHAVVQFRERPSSRAMRLGLDDDPGDFPATVVKPYLLDLGSTNGTVLNGKRLEPSRYYELLPQDVFRLGESSREYVVVKE